jgi:hypothetical integral membrane protein (TIGR02206 family)
MNGFFNPHYTGQPFQLFGTGHLIFLAVDVAILLFLIFGWKNPSEKAKRNGRFLLAVILLIWESAFHIWNLVNGTWSPQKHIPLHACSVMVWASIVMLFTKNYRIYEFAYFIGMGGAMQAVLTPEAGIYGLPHFRAFQTLIVHSTLVIVPVYMSAIEGFRPTWRSFMRVAIGINIYMVFVYFANLALDSNYMYLMRKPDTASLMDVLGPWPWYILSLEVLGFVIFFILYLPYFIKDIRAKKLESAPA